MQCEALISDMDGFASLWSCQEENMEMKQKLLSLSMELETLRSNTNREIQKKEKLIDELVHLLRTTMQERDEARVYLQLLQSYYQPDSPAMIQIGNCYSQNCSPENSSVVNLASPEFPSMMSMGDCGGGIALQQPAVDVFDQLAAKKPLAERGKLLQAVLEAGPLLDSIMAAGPLPRWHNPPPMQVPPVAIRGGGDQTLSYEPRTFGCMN